MSRIKGTVCPYCCNQVGLNLTDLLVTFAPWRSPFTRECDDCGRTFSCEIQQRAGAWYRFCFLPLWPVAAYVFAATLYADEPDRLPSWACGLILGFLPAIWLSAIPGHMGKRIESGRSVDSPVPQSAYVLYAVWPVIVTVLALILWILLR